MARGVDLTGENVTRRRRKERQYGTKTDLSSTTVDRGSTHWMNESYVAIDGVLDVTGLTTISGTLNVSGTTTLSGSTTIAGPTGITGALTIAGSMDVTGPSTFSGTLGIDGATTITGQLDVTGPTILAGTLDITGDTTVTGLLDITGDTTLTGNMDVLGGGKITVGNTILSPSATNGGVEFASGGGVGGNGGSVAMRGSANAGFLALSTEVASMFGGASFVDVKHADVTVSSALINLNAPQTSVNGNLVVTGSAKAASLDITGTAWVRGLPTAGLAPNLHITSQGQMFRSTWAPA